MEIVESQEYKVEGCQREQQHGQVNFQARDKAYKEYMELIKTLNISEFAPPEWLNHTENPFKWSQCLKPELLFKANLDSKLDDYSNNSCYILEKCSLLLTFVFENVILKDNTKSMTYLNQLKEEQLKIPCNESKEMFTRIGPALKHICSASNAYLMSLTRDLKLEETAQKIASTLEPISQMSPQVQAGVEALKGKFYLWCYTDCNYALQHMVKASKLDPDFAPWQYWTGKVLRKIRRDFKEKEPKEEIGYLESAVEKNRDPKHLIYLAQAYREKAQFLHKTKSCDFGFFKSDIAKEVDELNQKSRDLYSKTEAVQSHNLTGPTVHQIKERSFNSEISLVVCSEKMDLILTANSRGEVSLHRSLDLQTVWTKSPPNCEVKCVRKLTWRPDDQVIAIAYSYNEEECNSEDLVLKALVLIVTIENEELNSIVIDGDVTCLIWCESRITTTVAACFTDYFPEPAPLSSNFCVGVSLNKSKHMLKEKNESMMNYLVIGSSVGDLKIVVGGFLSCCSLNIGNLLGIKNKKYWIRSTICSSDMKLMFVFVEESLNNVDKMTDKDAQVLILDTSVLSLKVSEINLLKTRISQVLTLVDHITEVQSCLTEVWECLKVAEIASNFNKYVEHFDSIESMAADFCELVMFGVLSSSLEQFLLQSLNCNRVKKIIQSVKENCSSVQTVVCGYLIPFLEELLLILGEMSGMAEIEQYKVLGLANKFLSVALNDVRILILKAAEFNMVAQSLERNYSAFYQWLNVVITQLNCDESHVLDFSDGLTENNLSLIIDYLNSICLISCSYDKNISLFQHLGQYFEDTCLSKPLEPSKWQKFLDDKNDLLTVASFLPVSSNLSLAQGFKRLYKSVSSIRSAPEKAVTPLFSVKSVIDMPEMLLDCSVIESCYFTENLTLMTAFINDNNTGELCFVEVLLHEQIYIKRKKMIRLDSKNDYKCLDAKWYPNEKLFALFEERECSNLFLVQIEKTGIDMFNSDLVNINAVQEGVFVWRIPYFPVLCFAVSCKRKIFVAVSKSKRKIQTFDIGFEEHIVDKD